jgi:ATP-dependent Lon protease
MATTLILSKFLPNRPSEEYLRKEAKRLARGDSMQLAAAQWRLAREYGYPNWACLIDAVQAMASPAGGGSGADSSGAPGSPAARESARTIFPLLPLRGLVAFPHVSYPIFLGRPKSINAVLHAKEHNIPILLAAQKDSRVEDVTGPEMYKVGTLATVVETLRLPDGTVKSIIEGNRRASLGHISFDEDFAKAEAVEPEEPSISDPRLVSLVSSVLSAFVREHVRAVSAWEKDPESAGLSTAAIILREEQSAIESVLNEIERAVAVAHDGDTISVRHLSPAPAASALGLRQQLVMTPQLQQAIKILQLSPLELEVLVQNELGGASVASSSPASAKSASPADLLAVYERILIAEQSAFANLVQRYLKPNEASMLADRIASALRMELASKQALLEILNPAERLEKLLAYLKALS